MSSTSPTTSTNGSTQTANDGGDPGPGGRGSTTLYLYTFLATLLLLLSISAMIVFRSIIMRRRARLMIEEAIRNGTWVPSNMKPPPVLGEKPKLFDAYTVTDPDIECGSSTSVHGPAGNMQFGIWDGIKPLSTTLNKRPTEQTSIHEPESPPSPSADNPNNTNNSRRFSRIPRLNPFTRNADTPPDTLSNPNTNINTNTVLPAINTNLSSRNLESPTHIDEKPDYVSATVSVLISMPVPPEVRQQNQQQAQQRKTDEEEECPDVQFGVLSVALPTGWAVDVNAKGENSGGSSSS